MVESPVFSQGISFTNINTTNGLSDNFIRCIAVDHKGFLWIGTNEELNIYDGYSVTPLSRDEYPGIPSNRVSHLFVDRHDLVWMGTFDGAAWADEKRNIHRIKLDDSVLNYYCTFISETVRFGTILYTSRGQYTFNPKNSHWNRLLPEPPFLKYDSIVELMSIAPNKMLFCMRNGIYVFNYEIMKTEYEYSVRDLLSICYMENGRIALATGNHHLLILDTASSRIVKDYDLAAYSTPRLSHTDWAEVRMAAGENILYASGRLGFFIIDKSGSVTHYVHDPTVPTSIAADRVFRVLGTADGTVVTGSERYGLSIFNILKKQAVYQKNFVDRNGNYFDGYVTEMALDKDGTYWIGALDRLIHWDKKTNTSEFFKAKNYDTTLGLKNPDIFRVCVDKRSRVWVAIVGAGVGWLDKDTRQFHLFKPDTTLSPVLSNRFVFDLFEFEDHIWVGCTTGFYAIDIRNNKVTTFEKDDLLGSICHYRSDGFTSDSRGRLWISTRGHGIYCYDKSRHLLLNYTKKDGLIDDQCLDMMTDSHDNIYVTQLKGFNIISPEGKILSFTKTNGLRFDKADAFVEDLQGNIWISNAKCLIRMDPVSHHMDIYDEHENLNNGGFKPSSALRAPDGELIWGTQSGINYFFPQELKNRPEALRVSVYKVLAGDSIYTTSDNHRIRYRDNNLQFYFVAINLRGSRNIRYQYQLQGYDKDWQEGTDVRQARYSSLPPGHYTFRVRASADRKNWMEGNDFSLSIIAPLYMRWWFKTLAVLLIAAVLFYYSYRRSRQLREKKEELETEQAIHFFASSLYEHQTVDEILWDVVRNCIGRLQFEDCVIYLLDETRQLLVQKAAHGPKSPRSFEIKKPMDIPVGKGIVGAVAASGKPELVGDTTKDPRYIVDDESRLSEIAVPMVFNGKVLGVIDCEHSKKRFFTQKHLSILITIASLCANKIVRARTEEEKKRTEMMLAETKQKMTEAEMQALRAQMNPHFIFNCLNSINRYIVKSDQATASLYLTRFAKLIRLILDNSNSKNVILSNELEALKLYIEMESLRFDNKFSFVISIDPSVQADTIEIPPLIIQPYVENAIWHGLLHKTEGGHLSIHVGISHPGILECTIEDNGVGRLKAMELRSKTVTSKKSLGMELTENRLLLLNQYAQVHSSVEIVDLQDEQERATGTRVILKIPIN